MRSRGSGPNEAMRIGSDRVNEVDDGEKSTPRRAFGAVTGTSERFSRHEVSLVMSGLGQKLKSSQ
jgi:hypothetical protein